MRRFPGAEPELSVFDRLSRPVAGLLVDSVQLVEAVRTVDPSWAEAVAIVQGVCERLESGRTPPAVGDIRISAAGTVTFPPGGIVDDDVAIQLTARLLARLAGDGCCPFEVWDALERARVAPMTFRSACGFGGALTCLPPGRGRRILAAYVSEVKRVSARARHEHGWLPDRRRDVRSLGGWLVQWRAQR